MKAFNASIASALLDDEVSELIMIWEKQCSDGYSVSGHTDLPSRIKTDGYNAIEQADLVITATYKKVFGNTHLMESERFIEAESQLRSGQITVYALRPIFMSLSR